MDIRYERNGYTTCGNTCGLRGELVNPDNVSTLSITWYEQKGTKLNNDHVSTSSDQVHRTGKTNRIFAISSWHPVPSSKKLSSFTNPEFQIHQTHGTPNKKEHALAIVTYYLCTKI